MAHDIKKRSASHIYFGVHSESGEIMHISKVPSGQKCNCVCAACGQPFEARKGSLGDINLRMSPTMSACMPVRLPSIRLWQPNWKRRIV